MSELWFPDRPPFCTPQLIELFDTCATTILAILTTYQSEYVERLERVCHDLLAVIEDESTACLDTDRVLNELRTLVKKTFEGAMKGYRMQNDTVLFDLATEILVMKQVLQEKLEEVVSCQSLFVQS